MAVKSDTRIIRGIRLITSTLPVLEASVMWWKLGRVFSPAMVVLRGMSVADKTKLVGAISKMLKSIETLDIATVGDLVGALGPAAAEIFTKMDGAELPGLFQSLFAGTIAVNGDAKFELAKGRDTINAAFDGDEGALWLAAFWVGSHNFSSFGLGRPGKSDASSAAASLST